MLSIPEIQRWATVVPEYKATAAVLLVGVAAAAICGLLRNRSGLRQWLPGVLFVGLSAVAMWPLSTVKPLWALGLVLVAAVFALVWRARCEPSEEEVAATAQARSRISIRYFLLALGLAACLLFYNLADYTGDVLTAWEATVIFDFGKAFMRGQGVLQFIGQRFLWDDGILSAGNTSLFYGAPTYALFHLLGFSTWTLRCAAVVATLLSLAVAFVLARRFFGAGVAAALTLLLALNPAVLFYGRYGSSPAGTMLAVLLAVLATWLFLERNRSAWWRALFCAAALYLATVQYSPARIVVLILLAFIPVALAFQWRQLGWQRPLGVLLIAVAAGAVWHFESSFHRQGYFLQARGEQFFSMVKSADYINTLFGQELAPPRFRGGPLSTADEAQLLARALMITVPQYLKLVLPVLTPQAQAAIVSYDPPPLPLYYGPVALFIVWGLAHSLRRWRSWPHLCLLLWMAAGSVPLLLTNRVDSHRTMLLIIPLSFWAAFGVWEAARLLAEARVPRVLQHLLALALILTGVYTAVNMIYYPQPPRSPLSQALVRELDTVPGKALVGMDGWHRELGWAYLRMLERTRTTPQRASDLLEESLLHGLRTEHGQVPEVFVRDLRRVANGATVLLAPANSYRPLAAALTAKGLRVTERGLPEFHVVRVDEGVEATGVANETIAALPTPMIPLTPTPPKPIVLRSGPKQWVADFDPLSAQHGFAPPKANRTWDNSPLRLGSIEYANGIGMHAWCRATYPVPSNATAFQAIIGISDGVRECGRSSVTFEIRDDQDRLVYDSGLVDNSTAPQPVDVLLHGSKTITLVVTDGGNGIDCDHADWALAAFMLGAQ